MSEELHLDELEMVSRIGMATHPRVVGQLVDRLRAAEAEVARLTAVVQRVRELADEFREAWKATNESAQRMAQTRPDRPQLASYWVGKSDGYSKAVYRLRVLVGGTDTPKEAETNGDV